MKIEALIAMLQEHQAGHPGVEVMAYDPARAERGGGEHTVEPTLAEGAHGTVYLEISPVGEGP